MLQQLDIVTRSQVEFQDVTARVRDVLRDSGVQDGLCVVYVPHTTAAVTINEHADPDVVADFVNHLEKMVPQRAGYAHSEGNSAAHIKASLLGSSVTVPVRYGELSLGTWQGIFFAEFDGPRRRHMLVKVTAG